MIVSSDDNFWFGGIHALILMMLFYGNDEDHVDDHDELTMMIS